MSARHSSSSMLEATSSASASRPCVSSSQESQPWAAADCGFGSRTLRNVASASPARPMLSSVFDFTR